jgi:glycosyltransferase involved in cell wall biosynthesis
MARQASPGTVSVIICAFADDRWPDLAAAVDSVASQSRAADEVVVVVDHNRALLAQARRELPDAHVVANHRARGLSGARNSGIDASAGDVLAFMDDDAVAEPDWLARLLSPYDDGRVIAVGGAIAPRWDSGRPAGFPEEFDWVVGCTYRGMPACRSAVRNVIGANMSFRREVFDAVGGFRDGIGRIGRRPVGCEETELCLRALAAFPQGVILYEPAAHVSHRVTVSRASWRYFGARCYSEGLSKALVARHAGAGRGLSSERKYALSTLPRGFARGLRAAARGGDLAGLARAGAVLAGLSLTTAGFMAGAARGALISPRPRRVRPPDSPEHPWLHLDVHGRAAIRVQADAPGAKQLRDMFAPFVVHDLERCELTVHGRLEELAGMVAADGDHRYRSDAVELPGRLQVVTDGESIVLRGPGELLAPVLALLDPLVVRRGAAMVHAATAARDGRGVCLAAAGGAGKTSAAIGLVRGRGFEFMGDDWTFLSEEGRILGYAKPLFVRPHHRALFPHLFAAKRKPLVPPRLVRPLGRAATAVHPLISRHPRLAGAARRWWPEHMIVAPEDALPGASVATSATLGAAIFVERAACDAPMLERRDPTWMASRLVGDFFAELPRGARDLQAMLAAAGLLAIDELLARKGAILRKALEDVPCFLLQMPERMRAEEAAEAIATRVEQLLGHLDQREVVHA